MISKAFATISAFIGGFFTCALLKGGASDVTAAEFGIALGFTASAALFAGIQ